MASKNLLLNSDFTRGLNNWTKWNNADNPVVIDTTEVAGFSKAIQIPIAGVNRGAWQTVQGGAKLPAGQYTLSAWAKSSVSGKDYLQLAVNDGTNVSYPKTSYITATTTMARVSVTFTLAKESTVSVQMGRGGGDTTATTFTATGFQLEAGDTTTAWEAGTEPNLLQNTGFLDGLTKWNVHADATQVIVSRGIVDDSASPSSKAYYVKASGTGNTGLWQAYSFANATTAKTYTISFVAKGTGAIRYGWEGLVNVRTLGSEYQTFSYTFTLTGNYNYSFYINGAGEVTYHSMKMEEGSYATAYIASQVDINTGKDKPVMAQAQYTIVDYNDKVSLVASITSNQPLSQQYTPATETFIPNWAETNVVLSASLFKGSDTADIISNGDVRSIKWYKLSAIDGINPVEITSNSQYSVSGKTLTITQNILNDKDSIDFICEIVYRDPVTQLDLFTRNGVTFNRVRNGGALTKAFAWMPNGSAIKNNKALSYESNNSHIGKNLIRYTDLINNGLSGWGRAGTSTTAVSVINEPTAPTGKASEIVYTVGGSGGHYRTGTKLPIGRTYSWSVWVKASSDIVMNLGCEQGGNKSFNVTTSWQKFSYTFTSIDYNYYAFIFYVNSAVLDGFKVWIHSLKLEEGPVPTDWSMAPEDIPTIDEALGNSKWVLRKYNPASNNIFTPVYDDILNQRVTVSNTITDSSNLLTEAAGTLAQPYIGYLQTSIYSDKDQGLNLSFQNNDPTTIYVNNEQMYKDTNTVRNYYKMRNFTPQAGLTGSFNETTKTWDLTIPANDTSNWRGIAYTQRNAVLRAGKKYTISFEAYADIAIPLGMDVNNNGITTASGSNDNDIVASRVGRPATTVPGQWTRYSQTITMADVLTQDFYDYSDIGIANGWTSPATPTSFKIRNMMIEESATPSAYVPAPEDITKTTTLALKQGWNTVDVLYYGRPYDQHGIWNMWLGNRNILKNANFNSSGTITFDKSQYISTGFVKGSKSDVWGGISTSGHNLANATTYTLSFRVRRTGGVLKSIGGHLDPFYSSSSTNIQFLVDGMPESAGYAAGGSDRSATLDDGGWHTVQYTFTTPASMSNVAAMWIQPNRGWTDLYVAFEIDRLKMEQGSAVTPWAASFADMSTPDPNTISSTTQLSVFNSVSFQDFVSNFVARCQLMRGSVVDITNVQYQWYKQDGTVITDQGGGIGWLKLTAASLEQGYNTDALVIPPNAVGTVGYYKCIIRDTQVDSVSYNGYFSSIVTVTNVILPIEVRVEAVGGKILLNGQGVKPIIARLYQDGREIDTSGSAYTYKWYRYLADGTKDTAWQNNIGFKIGKTINITDADVAGKATFGVEIE